MFGPLYNDDFRDFLDANVSGDYETDSQIMARLINPDRWMMKGCLSRSP